MLLPGLLLAAGSLLAQGPASSLQKEFASQDPATRLHAALRYVASESPDPKWLRKELHHGSPGRTRALLVAAALLGTEDSLSLVEEASRRGKRKDSLRAFALLLYGAFHPRVVAEFGESLHRPASSEERDLLLAGTLMQARRLPALSSLPEGRDRDAAQSSPIAIFLDALAGRSPSRKADSPAAASALLLVSRLPGGPLLTVREWEDLSAGLPDLWSSAARRFPGRNLQALRASPMGEGRAFTLAELSAQEREAGFEFLSRRLPDPRSRAWLWGTLGDLGGPFPRTVPKGRIPDWVVAGILRLSLANPAAGEEAAGIWRAAARRSFDATSPLAKSWPAAVVLALAPDAPDLALLRSRAESARGEDGLRMLPIWQLASGRVDQAEARNRLLRSWSRELHAGYLGYLDQEAPRWLAGVLLAGTRSLEERAETRSLPSLAPPVRDRSRDDEFYADVAEFLFSPVFRLDLP